MVSFGTTAYWDEVRLAERMRRTFHRFFLLLTANVLPPPALLHTAIGGYAHDQDMGFWFYV